MDKDDSKMVSFQLGGMHFEYDEWKNEYNIKQHGISFKTAARVFFDYDRIEFFDEEHSDDEDRYDTIGDLSAGTVNLPKEGEMTIGNVGKFLGSVNDVLFVVYTERVHVDNNGKEYDVTRLISARFADNFERGIYYGKY